MMHFVISGFVIAQDAATLYNWPLMMLHSFGKVYSQLQILQVYVLARVAPHSQT